VCGIAGVTGRRADVETVRRMIGVMRSRGPDDEGWWESPRGGAALGNCRLAIIHLSPAGRMPTPDAEDRCRITYNGELYNFRELRSEHERHGHVFLSRTDTEIVLAAYLRWGADCLDSLIGMFRFAVHDFRDPNDPRLVLARERLGIKPWARTEDGIVFASEVKAILASGLVDPVLDRKAAWDYLTLGSVPGPRTIVRGVRSLPAGSAMLVRGTEVRRCQYWTPTPGPTSTLSTHEAAAGLRELLEEVVEQHLVADVPVGAFLSGGIDSAGIVAPASRATGHPVRTFSVAFGTGPEAQAELSHARDVAAACGADHSLEVRLPYVDHRIVEFALSLLGNVKLEGRTGKAILRHALADGVPEGSVYRPKSYFSVPLEEWVAGPILPRVRAALRSPSAARLFRPAPVRRLEGLTAHRRGSRAWAAAVLTAWMDIHEVSP